LKNGVFSPKPIVFTDDFDKLRKIIFLYACHQKSVGDTPTILRDKLITLLAIYVQRGYSRESKKFAEEVLGVDEKAIASMNLELRRSGLMHKDQRNVRINNLTKNIELLSTYLEGEDPDEGYVLFRLKRGKNGQ